LQIKPSKNRVNGAGGKSIAPHDEDFADMTKASDPRGQFFKDLLSASGKPNWPFHPADGEMGRERSLLLAVTQELQLIRKVIGKPGQCLRAVTRSDLDDAWPALTGEGAEGFQRKVKGLMERTDGFDGLKELRQPLGRNLTEEGKRDVKILRIHPADATGTRPDLAQQSADRLDGSRIDGNGQKCPNRNHGLKAS
jgi:hypothetical protein